MAALLEKAMQQYQRGDLKIALATVRRLLEKERRNLNGHLLAGTIHEQQGNLFEAARFFASAVPLSADRKREIGLRAAVHFISAGAPEKALACLLELYPAMPDDIDVNHGICSLLREAGRNQEALPFAAKLASLGGDFGNLLNAAIVLSATGHFTRARPLLERALALQPGERLALPGLFWVAANLCDFDLSSRLQRELEEGYTREGASMDIRENAFRAILWSGDEAYHLKTAQRTAEVLLPPVSPKPEPQPVNGRRIRIGYVTCDVHEHATLSLFNGVLEAHDRDRFEVFLFCHTEEGARHGAMRQRALAAVEHYVDILALTDDQAADEIRRHGIDILVDLKGFTQGARLGIFTRRPAAIQVSYLGFPGSVAGAGIDYAIADSIVAPPSSDPHFAEKIVRLPRCYQANDSARLRPQRPVSRTAFGLPQDGIVFAAFHQAPKIRAGMFDVWMDVLKAVADSVLWLAPQEEIAGENLKRAAAARGVQPERLIIAPKVPMAEHLARLAAADLALDCAPCNGHTTTSDALWAGVPVVTIRGTSFAGRVSESLLSSVGLAELVTEDTDAFVRLTNALAQDGDRLSLLRQKLIAARDTAPLFDTAGLTRDLEAAFAAMVAEGQASR